MNRSDLLYIGLELDTISRNTLLDFAESKLGNENFNPKYFCHHMTIAFNNGNIPSDIFEWAKANEGKRFLMNTTHYGTSTKAVAVRVETEVPSANAIKHITLATSKNTNGKPVDSNYITNWTPFEGLALYGVVKFFYKNRLNEEKNDKGENIPKKCDKCGSDIGLYIKGEPVYLCSKCGKYFGTMPFNKKKHSK